MKSIISLLTLIILLTSITTAISYPHAFYGPVSYSNGSQLNDLTIKAILGDFQDTSQIANSRYGENQDTLIVEAETDGGLIQFYISNQQNPIGNYTFKKFEITELNFIVPTPQTQNNSTPAPPNGEGSGSSSSSSSSGGGGGGGGGSSTGSIIILSSQNTPNQTNYTPYRPTTNSNETNVLRLNSQNTKSQGPGITGAVIGSNLNSIFIVITLIIAITLITAILVILKNHKQ